MHGKIKDQRASPHCQHNPKLDRFPALHMSSELNAAQAGIKSVVMKCLRYHSKGLYHRPAETCHAGLNKWAPTALGQSRRQLELSRDGGDVICSIAAIGALRIMEGAPLHATSWFRFHDSDVLPLSIACLATCVVGESAATSYRTSSWSPTRWMATMHIRWRREDLLDIILRKTSKESHSTAQKTKQHEIEHEFGLPQYHVGNRWRR